MTRFGVVNALRSCVEEVRIARACETAGFWGLGLGDTAPSIYQDTYVTAGACLAATSSLSVGPMVTNPITRHWSVLGATARSFEELAPGRFFVGIGTGDGAVRSTDLRPAGWQKVEDDVTRAAQIVRKPIDIHVAASGPRGVEAAGRVASDFVIGTGLELAALRLLSARARAARVAAGRTDPLNVWAFVNTILLYDESEVGSVRRDARGLANGYAHFAFAATADDKAIPEQWQETLRNRLARYDFTHHIKAGDNPNARLFDDLPELQQYLLDRMLLIGTPESCAARLAGIIQEAQLDGVWLAITPNACEDEPEAMVHRAGAAFRHLMSDH